MNNMIKSDNSLEELNNLLSSIPIKNHICLHNVINVEFRKTWGLPVRKIDDFMLAYVRGGNGHYDLGGTYAPIERGRIILITPELMHSSTQYELTPSLISARFGFYSNTTFDNIKKPCTPFFISFVPKQQEYFLRQFELINRYNSMKMLDSRYEKICNSYITYILQELLLEIMDISNNTTCDMRLESARLYIEKNIHQSITLDTLASISGLTKPYFSKLFKKQYGITPQNYLFKNKMNYAYSLLSQEHYSVKDTAEALGYSDPFIFSNQFKSFFGYPPSKVKA